MFLIIAKKFGETKRGAHEVSKRFCKKFPEIFEYKETSKATNLEELNKKYQKLIFRTQVPRCYSSSINFLKLAKINHLVYTREEYNNKFINSCTNGFYYYKNTSIKNYIPMITDFPKTITPDEICIGFYSRKWLTRDSFNWFLKKIEEWDPVNICIMGRYEIELEQKTKGKFKHTFNNVDFFNTITHYVMPKSITYVDPFPHTLLEAVQTGKQIIIPTIGKRNHKDGIDDIQDCIQFHDNLYPNKLLDNSNCFLFFKHFKKFYEKIIENNFSYSFDKKKYKTMSSWILQEVLNV